MTPMLEIHTYDGELRESAIVRYPSGDPIASQFTSVITLDCSSGLSGRSEASSPSFVDLDPVDEAEPFSFRDVLNAGFIAFGSTDDDLLIGDEPLEPIDLSELDDGCAS